MLTSHSGERQGKFTPTNTATTPTNTATGQKPCLHSPPQKLFFWTRYKIQTRNPPRTPRALAKTRNIWSLALCQIARSLRSPRTCQPTLRNTTTSNRATTPASSVSVQTMQWNNTLRTSTAWGVAASPIAEGGFASSAYWTIWSGIICLTSVTRTRMLLPIYQAMVGTFWNPPGSGDIAIDATCPSKKIATPIILPKHTAGNSAERAVRHWIRTTRSK